MQVHWTHRPRIGMTPAEENIRAHWTTYSILQKALNECYSVYPIFVLLLAITELLLLYKTNGFQALPREHTLTFHLIFETPDDLGRESLSGIIGAQETYTASDLTIAANAA